MMNLPKFLENRIFNPKFDDLAYPFLKKYAQMSRCLAAALKICDDQEDLETTPDVDAFIKEVGFENSESLLLRKMAQVLLKKVNQAQKHLKLVNDEWEAVAFSDQKEKAVRESEHRHLKLVPDTPQKKLDSELNQKRLKAVHKLFVNLRFAMAPLLLFGVQPVKWDIPSPQKVQEEQGERLADVSQAFLLPSDLTGVEIEESDPFLKDGVWESWVRIHYPLVEHAGPMTAHIWEPAIAKKPCPTIIWIDGVGQENEMHAYSGQKIRELVGQGFRVMRMELPFHGRRCPKGYYSGEYIFARAPLGFLELMQQAIPEVGLSTMWVRKKFGECPISWMGLSLGAEMMKEAAYVAQENSWNRNAKPHVVGLVTPGGDISHTVFESAFMEKVVGLPQAFEKAGWARRDVEQWTPLLEPQQKNGHTELIVEPNFVTALMAKFDKLLHFDPAIRFLKKFCGVPSGHIFEENKGHFGGGCTHTSNKGFYSFVQKLMQKAFYQNPKIQPPKAEQSPGM